MKFSLFFNECISFIYWLSFYNNYDPLPQDRRIRGLLEGCTLEHDACMDALHGRVRERVQSDARWKQLQRESNKAVCELRKLVALRLARQDVFSLAVKCVIWQRDNSLVMADQ